MSGQVPGDAARRGAEQENPDEARPAERAKGVPGARRVLEDVSNKRRVPLAAIKPPVVLGKRRGDADEPGLKRRRFVQRLPLVSVTRAEAAAAREGAYDAGEDDDDDREPQMCTEYTGDIYGYLYELQEDYMVDPAGFERLPVSLRWRTNRHTLVNWMVLLNARFYMVPETLYLSVNLVDRFLAVETVPLDKVQLLGAAAMFLAAKYEEVAIPSIQNYATACNADESDVRAMERRLLVALDFRLNYPSPLNFLRRISKADDYDLPTRTIGKFLLEIMLVEERLMVFRPSDVAAAAMLVARHILGLTPWTSTFVYYSGGCTAAALQPIVVIIHEYLAGPCERIDEELIRKYTSKKFMRAASRATQWARTRPSPLPPLN